MTVANRSLLDLLAAIRSPEPTPGGGSVSAIAGALGASLLAMVGSMPKHRAQSEEDVERLRAAAGRCTDLSERLTTLADVDTSAYQQVMEAYRLPKGTDEEKSARSARIQEALVGAVESPIEVMRRCAEAIEAAAVVAAFGNPNAASDVGVALELLGAGARGARLNVDINLPSIRDAAYVERVRGAAATLDAECATGIQAARARLAQSS